MSESNRRISRPVGIFFVIAAATLVATGLIFFRHRTERAAVEYEAAFGGWVYSSADQKNASSVLAKTDWIDYRWENGRLMVPAAKRGEYERILGENKALPSAPSDVKREALTEMTQFEPESKTRLRDLYSSGWQLEQTLARFEQIESATVGVHTRREQVGLTTKMITTATVGVWTNRGETDLSPELISAITLATRHQLGIAENENVSIMDLRNGRSYLGDDRAVGDCQSAACAEEQRRQEERWREKFERAFESIPGLRVMPSVELTGVEPLAVAQTEPRIASNAGASLDSGSMTLGNRFDTAGTLVFRPNSESPREPDSAFEGAGGVELAGDLNGNPVREPVLYRAKRIAVAIELPESYLRQHGEKTLETVRQTADGLLSTSNVEPSERLVRLLVYPDKAAADTNTAANSPADHSHRTEILAENTAENLAENSKDSETPAASARSFFGQMRDKAERLYAAHPTESIYAGGGVAVLLIVVLIAATGWRRRSRQGSESGGAQKESADTAKNVRDARADSALFYLDAADEDDVALDESLKQIRHRETETQTEIAGRIEEDPRRAAEILKEWIKTSA